MARPFMTTAQAQERIDKWNITLLDEFHGASERYHFTCCTDGCNGVFEAEFNAVRKGKAKFCPECKHKFRSEVMKKRSKEMLQNEEIMKKRRESAKKQMLQFWSDPNYYEQHSGENSHNYKHDLPEEKRVSSEKHRRNKTVRNKVFERDDYTCQCCKERGGKLVAHHIEPYCEKVELRESVKNCITLCEECHKEYHLYTGGTSKARTNCNAKTFKEWLDIKKGGNSE